MFETTNKKRGYKNKGYVQKNNAKNYAVIIVIALKFLLGSTLIGGYFEMRAFNKFSETKKANIFDAGFANLRIEACK